MNIIYFQKIKIIEQEKRNSVIIKLNKINNLHYKSKTIDFDNKSVSKKEKINYSEEIPKIEEEIKNSQSIPFHTSFNRKTSKFKV